MTISKRVRNMEPSPTLAVDAKAKALMKQGVDVISFGVGEPDFDTPDNIKKSAIEAIEKGFTKYTLSSGTMELREAIARKFERDNGLKYEPSQILVSCGAKHSIANALQAIIDEGDEVIIPSPYWVSYPEMVKLYGGVPVFAETTEKSGFRLFADAVIKKATPKTKAVIVNSPCNPTGAVYTEDELRKLADFAVSRNIIVISDEIYEKLVYNGDKHFSIAGFDDKIKTNTIVINGVSKSYAMTGWRIGYSAGPKEIINAMSNIQSQVTSNPCSISQMATVEALNGDQSSVEKMVEAFNFRRKMIVGLLNSIPGFACVEPKGAFYAMPNITGIFGRQYEGKPVNTSADFAIALLDAVSVAVVQGSAFGAEGYVRLSYATSTAKIEKGILRIKEFVEKLK